MSKKMVGQYGFYNPPLGLFSLDQFFTDNAVGFANLCKINQDKVRVLTDSNGVLLEKHLAVGTQCRPVIDLAGKIVAPEKKMVMVFNCPFFEYILNRKGDDGGRYGWVLFFRAFRSWVILYRGLQEHQFVQRIPMTGEDFSNVAFCDNMLAMYHGLDLMDSHSRAIRDVGCVSMYLSEIIVNRISRDGCFDAKEIFDTLFYAELQTWKAISRIVD